MFDESDAPALGAAELSGLMLLLAGVSTDAGDAELVDRITVLEQVKAAAAAAQSRMTAAFAASQRAAQVAAGMPAKRVGQGIPGQVALARRESPARAARYTGWATILVNELPRTFAALACGLTTEWRAMIVARETIWLSHADRAVVDAELADRLPALGDAQVEVEAKKIAYRLDPNGHLKRSSTAASGRRVSLRPAPDTMARLTALVPAAQGVAAYAALLRAADTARAAGDPRGRGQVMADTLIARVTGQSAAEDVPVHVDLVITDYTLFGNGGATASTRDAGAGAGAASQHADHHVDHDSDDDSDDDANNIVRGGDVDTESGANDPDVEGGADDDAADGHTDDSSGYQHDHSDREAAERSNEPAHLVGYGAIPAGLARGLARAINAQAWIRRLYRDPTTRELVAMDSRARNFPPGIRHALIIRDQICRTPWCAAPIRHADHALSHALGGDTSLPNGQGLCEACNYAKQAPGWHTNPGPGGTGESVTTTTPTGHTYTSRPPDLPGAHRRRSGPSALEGRLQEAGPPRPQQDQAA